MILLINFNLILEKEQNKKDMVLDSLYSGSMEDAKEETKAKKKDLDDSEEIERDKRPTTLCIMDIAEYIYNTLKNIPSFKFDKLKNVKDIESQINYSLKIFAFSLKDESVDMKSALWFPMTFEQKVSLMLHEPDITEFSLMLCLLVLQHGSHKAKVDKDDERLEKILNSLIYEKFMGL